MCIVSQCGSFVSGLTISSLCSLAIKELGWMPGIAAAPSFPSMRHLVSVRILEFNFVQYLPASSWRMKLQVTPCKAYD